MLEKLYIKNYLLLKDIEINFSPGFNIITGETGVGKSILINALGLILGERADYSIIGKNKEKMIIEGHLKTNAVNHTVVTGFIKDIGIEEIEGGLLILRRELYSKGYARNFINDSPVNVNDMKTLGEILVDIHSQNEHQSLLRKEVHIDLLDLFISAQNDKTFIKEINAYRDNYAGLIKLIDEHEELMGKKDEISKRKEFMEFQRREIKDVEPQKGEDDELETELRASENIEVIQQSLSSAYEHLYEESGSVLEKLKSVEKDLDRIKQFNQDVSALLKDISDSLEVINESGRQLRNIINNLSFDPERTEQVRERLHKLQYIKKKYGGSIDAVLELYASLEKDLSLLENFDGTISSLEKKIDGLKSEMLRSAQYISKIRKDKSKLLSKEIIGVLNELGLETADFQVSFGCYADDKSSMMTVRSKGENISLTPKGIDDVEFLIRVNKGSELSSLRKTASGGEVSRIMLAIKAVLADADKVSVLVFDEIDIGISGRIAQKAGRVMKNLSDYRQVISITHLAQIAALADEHFLVEKDTSGNETVTKIRMLSDKEKVEAVAKLLSGEKVTDASLKSAKELMK